MKNAAPLLLAALAACTGQPSNDTAAIAPQPQPAASPKPAAEPRSMATASSLPAPENTFPADAPAPGTEGGLPDDRTPVAEAPFDKDSAQGAANIVQTYFALIETGKYDEAQALWSDAGRASGMDATAFAASFGKYAEYHAQIGAPGRIEGAAGSLYVDVPVVTYGRLKTGAPFNLQGPVRLRRCNDVPGCTAEQREWRIAESALRPARPVS